MNQPEAVRMLISSEIEVNVKNSMGFTALDISDPNNGQVRETLLKAGALNAQSLLLVSSNSRDHLRSNLLPKESTAVSVSRFRKNTSNDTRNVSLVVAALIVTATFQAPLTAPAGHWLDGNDDNSNNNNALNITLVNTTSRINTTEIKLNKNEGSSKAHQRRTLGAESMFACLYGLSNSITFFSAIVVILILLPDEQISRRLSGILFTFIVCYASSLGLCSVVVGLLVYVLAALLFLSAFWWRRYF
ncbi:uncharacterized protein LOC132800792 [Ziziphus jujuba]|uniref:Uncharacterized protein LOC132800792 n=1 Tax=Ziziphus jujuba TaxID=326968 RepID=A0ABM4A2U6_ZIZJJ|nr:uncharacterized protein LOC132800792 [Ziziphus jujuba]